MSNQMLIINAGNYLHEQQYNFPITPKMLFYTVKGLLLCKSVWIKFDFSNIRKIYFPHKENPLGFKVDPPAQLIGHLLPAQRFE